MRAVVQRVSSASVRVDERVVGSIEAGLLVFLGVGNGDEDTDAAWIAEKVANLRIFPDDDYKMNLSLRDIGGSVLLISQFTLFADARKGRRPSYSNAAPPDAARRLYDRCAEALRSDWVLPVSTGEFQAVMQIDSKNEGPVTILLDSKKVF